MRIPLVCTFFAEQKELLFDSNMFKIFQAVLLEQGAWEIESENSTDNVPDLTRKSLGTPFGLLQNELLTSRDVVMSPLIRILKFAISIATHKTSSIHSKSACFVLSMFRLATILSAYEKNILSPFRDDIVEILRRWIRSARDEVSSDGRKGVGNVPMLTVLYAHLALILSVDGKNSNEEFLASAAFVRTHFNSNTITTLSLTNNTTGTRQQSLRTTIL